MAFSKAFIFRMNKVSSLSAVALFFSLFLFIPAPVASGVVPESQQAQSIQPDGWTGALNPDEYGTPEVASLIIEEDKNPPALRPDIRDELTPPPAPPAPQTPIPALPRWAPADITRGDTEKMDIALTFDGGGYEEEEPIYILDVLKARGIKTTMFITGIFIRRYPDVVRRMLADGHEIGNHTMNHPRLTEFASTMRQTLAKGITRTMLTSELNDAAALFKKVTGTEMAPLWRAPYGEINGTLRQWAFESGYIHIGWTADYARRESLDTLDWVYDPASPLYRTQSQIKRRIMNFGARSGKGLKGGIILMHLGSERKTDKASAILGEMIDSLTGRGYRFVKVSELIEDNAVLRALKKQRDERLADGMISARK